MGTCCSAPVDSYEVIPLDILELSKHQCEYDLTDSCSVTFYPSPHLKDASEYGKETLAHELFTSSSRLHNILGEIKCNNLIACNDDDSMIISQESKINPFIECAIRAWTEHYPLEISPQTIWLLILQSVAIYIYNKKAINPLLKKDKSESDKIKLTPLPSMITKDTNTTQSRDYSMTSMTVSNKEWIVKVKECLQTLDTDIICDTHTADLMSCLPYTNSTYLDEIACKLCAMNILLNSYEYNESTACGFPSITLKGKKSDWLLLRDKCTKLLDKKCDKSFNREWSDSLLPILDRFIGVYEGDIDCVFWNSMIKRGAMNSSNGEVQWYSGWVNCFFPLVNNHENRWCEPYAFDIGYIQSGLKNDDKYGGIEVNSFPTGLFHCDAVIESGNENETDENIKIVSGFLGYTQDKANLAMKPMIGWFIVANNRDNFVNNKLNPMPGIHEHLVRHSGSESNGQLKYSDDSSDQILIGGNLSSSNGTVHKRSSDSHTNEDGYEDIENGDSSDAEELGYVVENNKGKKGKKYGGVGVSDEIHKLTSKK